MDDGVPSLRQPVHERRLADVGEADERRRARELGWPLDHAGGVAARPAERVRVDEEVPEAADLALDLDRGLAIPLPFAGRPSK